MTALATAAFFAFGSLLVLFGANGNELVSALSLDDERLGLVGAMLSLGLGAGILVAGPLVDRIPRRPLFLASCMLVALAAAALGARTAFTALLVHAAAIGFGAGFYETLLNTELVERGGPHATRRLLFVHAAATLGAACTPLLIGALRETAGLSWHDTFRLAGILHVGIALAGVSMPWRRSGRTIPAVPATPSAPDRSASRGGSDRVALAAVCVATFVYVGVESALTLFIARFARLELTLGDATSQAAISAFWAGLLVGRLAAGLAPRSPGAGSIAISATAAAGVVASLAGGWIASPPVAMALTGLALGIVFPVMIALAGAALPERPGTAVGLAAGLGSLGGFSVPWITGRIALTGGLATALLSVAGWIGLLAAAAATVHRRLAAGRRT